ncbi:MAG TPA: rod-binding protein [Bacteriovoracaceae bacterium]|nr:rod-binding protein [Bacteriovoracaceae bacterium]
MNIKPTAHSIQTNQERKSPIKPFEDVAEGMETNFTSHMLAEMRKTVPKETPDSSAMEYYNSLLDYERAQLMAKSESGLGIKKVILEQIVPQHMKHYLKAAPRASHPEASQGLAASTKENRHE